MSDLQDLQVVSFSSSNCGSCFPRRTLLDHQAQLTSRPTIRMTARVAKVKDDIIGIRPVPESKDIILPE
jgi:hypothetical protein